MRTVSWIAAALLLTLAARLTGQQPLLQIVGEPYFGGEITVHLDSPEFVGHPAALAYGLDPLSIPASTPKGPWYIGHLHKILSLGIVPPAGRIDLPLIVPPEIPGVQGLPVIVQAFVPPRLSNPAVLRLDAPYLTPGNVAELLPPLPVAGANFGDRVAAGDFDGDGHADLVVGAAFESYQGIFLSGSAYVLWGPDWDQHTALRPPAPGAIHAFGEGLATADFDGDRRDDIVIAEVATDPPNGVEFAQLYLVRGRMDRQLQIELAATSPGSQLEAISFGRNLVTGDVTGDTIPDVVVGADATMVAGTLFSGAVMILPGPDLSPAMVIPNPTPVGADFFGASLTLFDVNGDAFLDIVEGSDRADVVDPETRQVVVNAGEVHIGYGPDFDTWDSLHNPHGLSTENRFGNSVAAADIDGDGIAELATTDNQDTGFVFWGGESVPSEIPKPPSLASNPFGETAFGEANRAFDVNGDGLDDFVIGDPFDGFASSCQAGNSGMIWVALAPYFSTFRAVEPPSAACGDEFGWSFTSHDMNGDAKLDLIVGVPLADTAGGNNSGSVVIFFGD